MFKYKNTLLFILCLLIASACSKGVYDQNGELLPAFCSKWNPDYAPNGKKCCSKYSERFKFVAASHKKSPHCTPQRKLPNYCGEMTDEQRRYGVMLGMSYGGDALKTIQHENGDHEQSFCSENNGFMAFARRLIPSSANRVALRFPDRCTNFGTDGMVGLLEWLGREIGREYSEPSYNGIRLVIADIAAPRGGCIWGHGGRMSHASHTNGKDADVGFITFKKNFKSPVALVETFDITSNWWMIKKIFHNPFSCVKRLFLDRKLIHKLSIALKNDPEWQTVHPFIMHVPGHHNHLHIRIGNGPGRPGCFKVADLKRTVSAADELDSILTDTLPDGEEDGTLTPEDEEDMD